MQKLIPIISQIQEIIRRSDVNLQVSLPMIAVVGSQSTGKSSLLQSIIGKQLLPKGKGIVTRRPIEIQLCQIQGEKEYAEFVDKKGEHYEDFEEFKKLIDAQTQKVCGQNKGISNVPLRIRLYSRKVLDLLLVDLPGIIKNPVGDQPKDIQQQVLKMIKGYIKNPNCIIVAVSKAIDDSANSQSLKLARQIDKQGLRTIGVLTQVDLLDQSINVLKDYNTLSNKLALGYVCVYLRPIKSSLSIQQQYEKENQFFKKHEQYQHVHERMGVRALIKTLNVILVKHIKAELPVIRENLIYLLQTKKQKMEEYGPYETITDKKTQGILILGLVSKYVRYLIELIEGRYTDSRQAVIGGARIEFIFSQVFIKSINKLDPFEYLTDNDIRTAIRNANGLRKSLFLPEAAFQNLLRTQISRLKLPSLQCAHLIHEQLRRLIYSIKISEIQRYENLNRRISQVMEQLLSKSLKKTQEMIKNIIQIELGYINTNHPDFIDVISLVKTSSDNKKEPPKMKMAESDMSFESQSKEASESLSIENNGGLFKFNRKKNNVKNELNDQSQILDAKLNQLTTEKPKPKKQQKMQQQPKKNLQTDSFYTSYTQRDNLPRYKLPCVPPVIKVPQNPKLREQTQTQMIKRLITSYFNVVKKNINDSVPKSVVTFLVNHTRNSCEKILVNNLYVEKEFDNLLHEKEYILAERERLTKDCHMLRECLDLINTLDSQLAI